MGDHVSAFDTVKSLVTFSPSRKEVQRTYTTGTYQGGAPIDSFGPNGNRLANWSDVASGEKLERSYRLCATAYACATLLADAVAESPLRVYQVTDGDPQEVPNHRARQVLANPNPYMSEAEFMSLVVMQMGLYGYATIEKVRSAGGTPVQLWPLRPDWLRRERANNGEAVWVLRRTGFEPRIIPTDDLIMIPYRHDERQERIGITPLQIVAREVGIDVALTDLLKTFLDAGGIPPWAVEVPDANPDQDKVDVFRERWSQRYGGTNAYRNIGILHGGMKLVKVGDSIGDMAWSELRGITELKIAQAYRVPGDLIQARETLKGGSLTTTETEGAMAVLQMYGATPLRQRIDGAFTRSFLPEFTGGDSSYTVEFDTEMILSLQEDKDALHVRARADWDSGLIMLNEARIPLGYPDLNEQGNVFKTAFTTVYLPLAQLAEPATTIAETPPAAIGPGKLAPQYRNHKAMTSGEIEVKANVLTVTARDRKALGQILDRKMRQFWREQGKRVTASIPKSTDDLDTKADPINWREEQKLLAELMDKFYATAGDKAYAMVTGVTGAEGLTFDLANRNVQRLLTELGKRIVGISETTRLDVSKTVATGLTEGLSPPQIADTLTTMFEQTYKNRAATVARTESMVAYNTASTMGYRESGVVDRIEMVDNADHPEDYGASDGLTCAQRDGMVVDLSDVDRHIEAEHPNGSLALIPILSGPALGEV
jgi:HK97 family phage portal protein